MALRMQFGLPHPSIIGIPWCVCTHPIDPMDIHFLCYVHGNKRIGTHDAICDTFIVIARDVGFHVWQEQLHVLPSSTFNSFRQWVDIVFTKDGVCTLAKVVIANPTWANLFFRFCTIQGFVTINVVQAKEKSYCNWHPIDQILPLAIEVFGYLHKHVNVRLHNCANAIWSLKRPMGLHFPTLVIFLCQKISFTLQRMQASSIFSWIIIVGLTTFWLPPLQDTPSITTNNLLHVVDFWHGQIWLTYCRQLVLDMERFWHLFWGNLTSCNYSFFLLVCTFF